MGYEGVWRMFILTLTFKYFSLELIDQILSRNYIFTYLSAAEEFLFERIYNPCTSGNCKYWSWNPVGLMLLFHKVESFSSFFLLNYVSFFKQFPNKLSETVQLINVVNIKATVLPFCLYMLYMLPCICLDHNVLGRDLFPWGCFQHIFKCKDEAILDIWISVWCSWNVVGSSSWHCLLFFREAF